MDPGRNEDKGRFRIDAQIYLTGFHNVGVLSRVISDYHARAQTLDKFTCVGVTLAMLAASSLALFNHPSAALTGVSAFFVFTDRGGNPEAWLLGWVGDLDFTREGLGAVLLATGEALVAALLSAGEGLGAGLASAEVGWGEPSDVDFFTSSRNFSTSAVCIFCASNDIWSAFSSSSCSLLAISVSLKKIKELKLAEKQDVSISP